MWKIIAFLCLNPCSVFAVDNFSEKIGRINERLKKVGSEPCQTCDYETYAAKNINLDATKKCVETLCPDEKFSRAHILNLAYRNAAKENNLYNKEFASIINETAKLNTINEAERFQSALDWLKKDGVIRDRRGIRFYNFVKANEDLEKFQYKETPYGPVVDEDRSRAIIPEASDEEFKRRVEAVNRIIPFYRKTVFHETDPSRLKLIYPGEQFKNKIKEVLDEIDDKAKALKVHPDFHFLTILSEFNNLTDTTKLMKQFDNGEINPDFIDSLNSLSIALNLWSSITKDPKLQKALDSEEIDLKKSTYKSQVQNVEERLAQAKKARSFKGSFGSKSCKFVYSLAQEGLPTKKQIVDYKTTIDKFKARFIEKMKGHLSAHSADIVQAESQKWKSILPLSREEHRDLMKKSLSDALQSEKSLSIQNKEIQKSEFQDLFYGVQFARGSDFSPNEVSDDICKNLEPNLIPDASHAISNGFIVGPLIVKYQKQAEGVTFHELGHLLYHTINSNDLEISPETKAWFAKTRDCLIRNHTEYTQEELDSDLSNLKTKGFSQYDSEDWPDLISSIIDDKRENIACLFGRVRRDEDYFAMSLRNTDVNDEHSSDFFRILHLHFLKNSSLPPVCREALDSHGQKANFKNCLSDP